jgi:hypothetical protein
MERKAGKNKKIIIGAIALAVLIAAFAAVYFLAIEKPVSGEKDIKVEVVHSDKAVKTFQINTDAQYLRQALEEKNLIQGTESALGLLVTTVDGETADDSKQEWWYFTKGGEYIATGIDKTPIKDGDKFEFTFTVGYEDFAS